MKSAEAVFVRKIGVLILLVALSPYSRSAQAQAPGAAVSDLPTFEAISVKESSGARIPLQWQGPRLVAGAIPLQTLLIVAYNVPMYQLTTLPEWVRTVPWEISAVASRVPTQAEQMPLLRALLAERFRVVARTETQERPLYALVMARPDGRPGPGLRPTTTDCIAIITARGAGRGTPPGGPPCDVAIGRGFYRRNGIPLALLVDTLTTRLERPVVDRTGLTGLFDVDLHFRPLGDASAAGPESNEPDLVTALADQLGLKVESIRGSVQVTVFDRLERPTPD